MTVDTVKHVYVENYHLLAIYNIELATDQESYYDVNINLKQGKDIISAATYECATFESAEKLAKALAKQYKTEYVLYEEQMDQLLIMLTTCQLHQYVLQYRCSW